MKVKKIGTVSLAALLAVAPVASLISSKNAQATVISREVTIMHTALAYDKNGNSTGKKYYAYKTVPVVTTPVKINDNLYYKVSNAGDQYIKATNIFGVQRKLTHNAYIYRTSTGRTSYNGLWKLNAGQTVTTYGGSYKFKNGQRYFRIGGPQKQYIKSANLGSVVETNTLASIKPEETTVTVVSERAPLLIGAEDKGQIKLSGKYAKKGDTFTVDRLEMGSRAGTGSEGDDDNELAIYHIKGTDNWISNFNVKATKELPVYTYDTTNNYSYIQFIKDTDVYNADGTMQDHDGQKIRKQGGHLKVDKLVYIWVPSENKAELFYHLVGTRFYATTTATIHLGSIDVGKQAYVKASDVEFLDGNSAPLTPTNTPEQAKSAYEASKNK